MKKIPNTQEIQLIIMRPSAFCVCDIGGDMYENKLEITMNPAECYPDYTELQAWIMENIDGRRLNIEDVVAALYDFIGKEFNPINLEVRTDVTNCRTHFDVTAIK